MSLLTLRHARRFHEVLRTLVVHGYGPLVERLPLPFRLPFARREFARSPASLALHTRTALEELGPTFVKMGQILSTRVDLVPPEFTSELRKLQEEVPPVAFEEIAEVVTEELGASPDEFFSDFSREPLASASIAQVHTATYRGQEVVVKIQRPGIARVIDQDIEIITFLAGLMDDHVPEAQPYRLPQVARDFGRSIRNELDFVREADSVRMFGESFADQDSVVIPKVFGDVSSRRVLTLTRLRGGRLDQMEHLPKHRRQNIARVVLEMSLHQVFEMGAFHADPHPGNLLVLADDRVGVLDFGMVGLVDEETKQDIADLLMGILNRDYVLLADMLTEIGEPRKEIDSAELRRDIMDIVERNYSKELDRLNLGQVLISVMHLLRRHAIGVPPHYISLVKAVAEAESSARLIYPDLRLSEELTSRIHSVIMHQLLPDRLRRWSSTGLLHALRRVRHWGARLSSLMGRADRGEISIMFRHVGLETLIEGVEKIAHRMILAMLMAALIIGGSVILHLDRPPFLFGYATPGVIAYVLAFFMGLWLLIVRRG